MEVSLSWIGLVSSLLLVTSIHAQGNSTTPPRIGCVLAFTADDRSSTFHGSCASIGFECTILRGSQAAYVKDCRRYYVCANRRLFLCPCSDGTAFDVAQNGCIDEFFANCSCPNGTSPPVTTAPATMVAAQAGSDVNRVIVGAVVTVIVVIIVIIIITVLIILRRRRSRPAKMMPSPFGQQTSMKSGVYEDITLKHTVNSAYLEANVYDNREGVERDENVYDNSAFEKPDPDHVAIRRQVTTPGDGLVHSPSISSGSTIAPPLPPGHPSAYQYSYRDENDDIHR